MKVFNYENRLKSLAGEKPPTHYNYSKLQLKPVYLNKYSINKLK